MIHYANVKITQMLNSQLSKDSYVNTCQTGLGTLTRRKNFCEQIVPHKLYLSLFNRMKLKHTFCSGPFFQLQININNHFPLCSLLTSNTFIFHVWEDDTQAVCPCVRCSCTVSVMVSLNWGISVSLITFAIQWATYYLCLQPPLTWFKGDWTLDSLTETMDFLWQYAYK